MKLFQHFLFLHPDRTRLQQGKINFFMHIRTHINPCTLAAGENTISHGAWKNKAICLLLATMLLVSGIDGTKIYAEWITGSTQIADDESKNYDDLWVYGNITIRNSGTVHVSSGFYMMSGSTFINDGSFEFSGNSGDFTLDTSSFINNGTARISDVYSFVIQEGTSFINNGTLFLENIQNPSLDGFTNNGIIVLADDCIYLELRLQDKTTQDGKVFTKEAFESQKANYSINYDLAAPDGVTNNNPLTYEYAAANPQTVTIHDLERAGYQFLGWTGADTTTPTKNFTFPSSIQQDITLTAHWQPETYQITYELDGGSFLSDADQKNTYTVEDGNYLLPQPQKTGYIFLGWTGSNGNIPEKSVYIDSHSTGNKTFTANFIAATDTKYYVICYYQNIGGGYSSESHLSSGKTGETAHASFTDYGREGFTSYPDHPDTRAEGTIAADNSLQLKLYYSRNKYTVTYKTQDGSDTLWETEKFYGEKIGAYGGQPPKKESGDSLYTYDFDQWAKYENLNSGMDFSDFSVEGNTTFYAAFRKVRDENTVVVRWLEYDGFQKPETEVRLTKGSTYSVDLELENEKYYIGTNEWFFPSFALAGATWNDPQTGDHPVSYEVTMEGFGKPVTLTIPDVEHDLSLIFQARYHEEHDFSEEYDKIVTDGGCVSDSIIRHFCYKCGKTCDETIPADGHASEARFVTDEASHWKLCRICGATLEMAAHTPDDGVITRIPTHSSTGTKTYSCTVCGYVTGREMLPMVEHDFGSNWECTAGFHYKTCECGEQLKETHIPDQGTVTREPDYDTSGEMEYKCTVCGYVIGTSPLAPLGHEVEDVWQTELSGHWKNCVCGKRHNAGAHISDGGKVISLPTATSSGTKIYSCTVCGYVLRTETTPPTGEKPSPSPSPSPSPTPTTAPTPSPSPSPTTAPSPTPTMAPTPSTAPTMAPIPTAPFPWQPDPVLSPTPTPSPTPTATPTPTMTQTPAATPAPTPLPVGPQAYTSLRLYYGGDATGKYANSRYAVVWNRAGYTVEFASENPEVATVSRHKGLVTAISTGTAKIRITFTDQTTGEKTIKICRVTVKRNAVDAGISDHSAGKLLQLRAGEIFQTKVWRADSDGNVVWHGRTQITDGVRFISSDPDVFTVGKHNGKITAVAPGEAILMVWAVQTEGAAYGKDGNVIAYKATTVPRFYRVSVE